MAPHSSTNALGDESISDFFSSSHSIVYIVIIAAALLLFIGVTYTIAQIVKPASERRIRARDLPCMVELPTPAVDRYSSPLPLPVTSICKVLGEKKKRGHWATRIRAWLTARKERRQERKEEKERLRQLREESEAAYARDEPTNWAFHYLQENRRMADYMAPMPSSTPLPAIPTPAVTRNSRSPNASQPTHNSRRPLPVPHVGLGFHSSMTPAVAQAILAYPATAVNTTSPRPSSIKSATPDLDTPSLTDSDSDLSYIDTPATSVEEDSATVVVPNHTPCIQASVVPAVDKLGPFRISSPRDSFALPSSSKIVDNRLCTGPLGPRTKLPNGPHHPKLSDVETAYREAMQAYIEAVQVSASLCVPEDLDTSIDVPSSLDLPWGNVSPKFSTFVEHV